jgi:hypothetical protein
MTDSYPSTEKQPSKPLGMIMKAANALSSIVGGSAGPEEQGTAGATEQPASEKPLDHDSSDGPPNVRDQIGDAESLNGSLVGDIHEDEAPKDTLNEEAETGAANTQVEKAVEGQSDSAINEKEEEAKTFSSDLFGLNSDTEQQKRYLPDHKKADSAPTFPEKVSTRSRDSRCCLEWHIRIEWEIVSGLNRLDGLINVSLYSNESFLFLF